MGNDEPSTERRPGHSLEATFLRNWSVPLLYLIVLVVVYVRFGFLFQFTLGLVWLAVVPVVAYIGKSREFLKNTMFFITLLLSYEALQGVTGDLVSSGNVVSLAYVDKALFGFDFASAVQSAFASPSVTLVSTIFYGLHMFLVVIAVILFWFTSKTAYRGYAYSMVLTSFLALITFAVLPTAPPWFSGTAQNLLPAGNMMLPAPLQAVQQALISVESDSFAAFPSLHAAYVTLFAIYSFRLNRKFGLVGLAIACGVFFSTIYLGQHYVVDLVGAVAYSSVAVLIVDRLVLRYPQNP